MRRDKFKIKKKEKRFIQQLEILRLINSTKVIDLNRITNKKNELAGIKATAKYLESNRYIVFENDQWHVTDTGLQYLEDNKLEIIKYNEIEVLEEMTSIKFTDSVKDEKDLYEKLINAIKLYAVNARTISTCELRLLSYKLAEYYEHIGEYGDAIHYYIKTIYYDLSGANHYSNFCKYLDGSVELKSVLPYVRELKIDFILKSALKRHAEQYKPEMIMEIFNDPVLEIRLLTISQFKEIIENVISQGLLSYNVDYHIYKTIKNNLEVAGGKINS